MKEGGGDGGGGWAAHLWVAVSAVAAMGLCHMTGNPNTPTQAGVRAALPDPLEDYFTEPGGITPEERQILPRDTEMARATYHSYRGHAVTASVVLAGGEKRSIHRPEECLPGQGWTIRSHESRTIALPEGGGELPVTVLRLERQFTGPDGKPRQVRSFYLYWFVGKGAVTSSNWRRVFLTAWDRLAHRINHRWAYVSLSTRVEGGRVFGAETEEEALRRVMELGARLAPRLMEPETLESLRRAPNPG